MSDFYKMNDNKLRDKLSNHEFAKMPGSWEQMEKMLQAEPATAIKAGGAYWWSLPLAAAAVFSGILTVGVYFNATQNKDVIENKPVLVAEGNKTAANKIKVRSNALTNNHKKIIENKVITSTKKQVKINKVNKSTKTVGYQNKSKIRKTKVLPVILAQKETKEANLAVSIKETNNSHTNDKTNKAALPIKKTRTIVRYQYSMTPLKTMLERRRGIKETNGENIGVFGISNELKKANKTIKVGAYVGMSTKVLGSTQKVSIMPTAGLTANYKISPKHSLQAGVQYKPISLNGLKRDTAESVGFRNYNDGYTDTKAYNIDRLDMLEIPITYQYRPHPKFSMHAGVKGSWIFNKQSSNATVAKMKNKELGIATLDLGMLLGMEIFLNKNISVGIQYSMGFMNLMQNAQDVHNEISTQDAVHTTRTSNLTDSGECLVPVNEAKDQMVRLPKDLRNNDVQLLIKYTF